MNISSASSSTVAATSLTGVTQTRSSGAAIASEGTDRAKLTKLGELASKLQDLEASDPDKAKQVLAKIASALSSKADETGDARLKQLAGKFDQASQTGDLSQLRPHHHRHPAGPPPGGDAAASANSTGSEKLASYAKTARDPMAEVESIISDALGA